MKHLAKLTAASALVTLCMAGLSAPYAEAQTARRTAAPPQQRVVMDDFEIAEDWAQRIQPNFGQYAASLRREFNRLTPEDIDRSGGGRAEIVTAIQDRYALSNERATDRLAAWQMRQR